MGLLLKFTLAGLALMSALIAVLALAQTALLFPRALVGPLPAMPADTRDLRLERPGGEVLHGHLIPGSDPRLPVLLGFGGNAWNAGAVAFFLHQIAPAHTVVAFHYRGYAPSTGRPSAAALLSDAEAVFDLMAAQGDTGMIAVGFSIGSGVAAHLAATRPLRGVVLVTPFDRLSRVAQASFPFAPVGLLFRHEMDAESALAATTANVALILAARDEVIPPARAEALAIALPDADVTRIDAGHNDIYNHPAFAMTLRSAIAGISERN
ncbi:MAG: hypothetical protein EA339_12930 [Rhodobacteraceae bacterium]|nr:MAG: hypothetical protein EA339_12930 [Paracoccaceae bacterium]